MRRLENFCSEPRILSRLRQILEEDLQGLFLLSPDPALGLRVFESLVEGSLQRGLTLGALAPEDGIFAAGDPGPATRLIRLNPEQGLTLPTFLRSALRQDPDSLLLSSLPDEALQITASALLTGHGAGTLILTSDATIEDFTKRLQSHLEPFAAAAVLASSCFAEISNRFPREVIRRVAMGRPRDPNGFYFQDWVRQREPDFDLQHDPDRTAEFFASLYEFAPPSETSVAPKGPSPSAPPAEPSSPILVRDPLSEEPFLSALGATQRTLLSRQRKTACVPVWLPSDPALLAAVEQASRRPEWPLLMGRKALLALQLRTDELPEAFPFLPPDHLLRIFFTAVPDQIQDLENPFHEGFRVDLLPTGRDDLLPMESRRSFLRESFPVSRFDLALLDYPSSAELDVDFQEQPPHWHGTKLGGWPSWLQHPETPLCRICNEKMSFFFQFTNTELADSLVAPDFVDSLFVCERHPEVWAFVHQTD